MALMDEFVSCWYIIPSMKRAIRTELVREGYKKMYEYTAKPREEDPLHLHPFDAKLLILEGDIIIEIFDSKKLLTTGSELEIPRNTMHSAIVGKYGCRYIMAERQ